MLHKLLDPDALFRPIFGDRWPIAVASAALVGAVLGAIAR